MDQSMHDGMTEMLKIRPPSGEINGIILRKDICEIWDKIWAFQVRSDDLLICSYPKAGPVTCLLCNVAISSWDEPLHGTTWMQEIVDLIQHDGDVEKCRRAPIYYRIPFIDGVLPKTMPSVLEICETMLSPRTIKSHLPIQLIPPSFWEQNCKVIYVARNAKDSLVSLYYFYKMNQGMPEPGTWDEFFEKFQAGKLIWSSWYDHVKGWWDARNRHRILYIFYEDMKQDPRREIRKVLRFLEKDLAEEILEKIIHHTAFQAMRDNPMANYSTLSAFDQSISLFFRKGEIGDWKNHFTVAQNERFNEEYKRRMSGTTLRFRTEP